MICADTSIVIWGVQGVARPDQVGMIDRTRRFLRHLARQNERLMVPAVVVAEYLHNFPPETHQRQIEALETNFYVPPFDVRCAALASEIQSTGKKLGGVPGARAVLKADSQIIATAVCHGADAIVTGNIDEFRRLAGNRIPIWEVPDVWEQGDLLEGRDRQAIL